MTDYFRRKRVVKLLASCTFAFMAVAVIVMAQAPAVFRPKPVGSLKQVMRGIPYPNSEIIFAAQTKTPGSEDDWKIVQSAAIAIAKTANIITMPRRTREDGRPVPTQDVRWNKLAQALVTSAVLLQRRTRQRRSGR
jgi:hypothetical protein